MDNDELIDKIQEIEDRFQEIEQDIRDLRKEKIDFWTLASIIGWIFIAAFVINYFIK